MSQGIIIPEVEMNKCHVRNSTDPHEELVSEVFQIE
jgi:hypothetical protein